MTTAISCRFGAAVRVWCMLIPGLSQRTGRGIGGSSNLSAPDRFCVWVEPDLLPQHTMSKTRVLVAKSELNTSAELEISLRRLGYDVTGRVQTGPAVIRQAQDAPPDVVLMDLGFNGIARGTHVASIIQKKLKLPVIYLSSDSSDLTLFRARDTEPFGFLLTPFHERQLKAAIELAVFRHRMEMEREQRTLQLQKALGQVKALRGLLPICSQCRRVRDSGGFWSQVETYIEQRSEARFSHGLCPGCFETAMTQHRAMAPEGKRVKANRPRTAVKVRN